MKRHSRACRAKRNIHTLHWLTPRTHGTALFSPLPHMQPPVHARHMGHAFASQPSPLGAARHPSLSLELPSPLARAGPGSGSGSVAAAVPPPCIPLPLPQRLPTAAESPFSSMAAQFAAMPTGATPTTTPLRAPTTDRAPAAAGLLDLSRRHGLADPVVGFPSPLAMPRPAAPCLGARETDTATWEGV